MTPDLDQLVHDVIELTGGAKPTWFEDGAPLLGETATRAAVDETFYLIGLIGGKDVGKSALVNALVGHPITAQTSHGPGTETVIAYSHESQAEALKVLLDREVHGRFSIVTHQIPRLYRQVLLDLPDIDSHYVDHLEVTRRMLRHMLFPIWVQSVEKYADRQPQQMLGKVAAGNSPANFVFCLNKVDQVDSSVTTHDTDGRNSFAPSGPIKELQDDFARRLAKTLGLPAAPRVWAISAIRPERYELQPFRDLLAQQKTTDDVRLSRQKAIVRQQASMLQWLAGQDLSGKAARLERMQDDAEESITERIGVPLLEGVIPRLLEDAAHRQSVIDDCMNRRVARWPVVNVLHMLFSAIVGFFRRNAEARPRPPGALAGELLVDQYLVGFSSGVSAAATSPAANTSSGQSLAAIIQTTFALLQQTHPAIGPLYRQRKLWESLPASMATGQLRESLVSTVDRQRSVAGGRACGKDSPLAAAARTVIALAALVPPIIQPILSAILSNRATTPPVAAPPQSLILLFVNMLGVQYLLNTLTFLVTYFSVIWLLLRWDTQRRVGRQFAKWKRLEGLDPTLSLGGRAMEWLSGLLEPIRTTRDRFESVATRVEILRKSIATE